jgi:MoxR-like ATPase
MTGLSAYTCTPRQIRKHVIRCIQAGLVPFIQSSPAMGKSAIVRSIADQFNLHVIDHRMSASTPEDFSGLPKLTETSARFVPFENFPVEGTPLPEGKDGWLLFLDEFNSGIKMVQAASYKLLLDKMVGLFRLHPRVVIVCAGNLATDRAIVNPLSTAMQSRIITLVMQMAVGRQGVEEFIEDVCLPQKWDSRIIAYLSYNNDALYDFRPDHEDKTFCGPRTWEFMNKLIKGREVLAEDAALYAGVITSGEALRFITFTEVFASLPQLAAILKDPSGLAVPSDKATKWATITYLIENAEDDNFDDIATYVNRFGSEFRVLFFRGLMVQKPQMRKHAAFRKAMVELSRELHDDIDDDATDIAAAA